MLNLVDAQDTVTSRLNSFGLSLADGGHLAVCLVMYDADIPSGAELAAPPLT